MSINHENTGNPSVDEALQCLMPEAIGTLAVLFDKPRIMAIVALNNLNLGTRFSMEEMGIVSMCQEGYELTAFGYDVAFAARQTIY